ncbi:MAG: hypothetical protein AB7O38_08660 [Pirellulaceae bacterium]
MIQVSAPIGGLNTRDSLSDMKPTDAYVLTNWFPTVGSLELRKGFESYATGVGVGDVETLAEYHVGTNRKFLACGGTEIYNITGGGAASSLASGFTNARWQWAAFNSYLLMCNGADTPQVYDGSTIAASSISGSGLTVTELNGVCVFKNRLFLWEEASQDFWYLDVNAITGTATKFPLSRVAGLGGNITAIATWTIDGGDGVDDMLVIVMSSGQVVVYQGTDPSDAAAWGLQGIYHIGAPLAPRGVVRAAGDLMIMTKADYYSLSQVLRTGEEKTTSTKISGAAAAAARSYGGNYGWQAINYPKGNRIIFNVPRNPSVTYDQHVMNTITHAWTKFEGMNARCFGIYDSNLYFGGGGGIVYLADEGYNDDGSNINSEARQAWNLLKSAGNKRITAMNLRMAAEGTVTVEHGLAYDYKDSIVTQSNSSVSSGSPWDTSSWDTSDWSPESTERDLWVNTSGVGKAFSLRMRIASQDQAISWHRTDYMYEEGFGL